MKIAAQHDEQSYIEETGVSTLRGKSPATTVLSSLSFPVTVPTVWNSAHKHWFSRNSLDLLKQIKN